MKDEEEDGNKNDSEVSNWNRKMQKDRSGENVWEHHSVVLDVLNFILSKSYARK